MASEDIFFIIIGIFFIITTLITITFSSINLITIIAHWRTHCRSILNLLAINSCAAFLLFSIAIAIQIPSLFQNNEVESKDVFTLLCRLRGFFFLLTCVVKSLSYLTQAVSRFFAIVLYKRKILTTYSVHGMMIGFTWILAIILSGAMLISPVAFQYEPESRLCILTSKVFETSFTLMAIAFMAPVSGIVSLYCVILYKTARANRINPNNVTNGNQKRNIKVFQNIMTLWAIVIAGGTPYLLCILINKISYTPWPLYSISILFILMASAIESTIIFFTNKEVKRLFYQKIGLRVAPEVKIVTMTARTRVLTNRMIDDTAQVTPIDA